MKMKNGGPLMSWILAPALVLTTIILLIVGTSINHNVVWVTGWIMFMALTLLMLWMIICKMSMMNKPKMMESSKRK